MTGAEGLVTAVTLENAADTVVEASRRLLEQRVQQVDRVEDVSSRLENLHRKHMSNHVKMLSYIYNQEAFLVFTFTYGCIYY